jgi:hypothetical protein
MRTICSSDTARREFGHLLAMRIAGYVLGDVVALARCTPVKDEADEQQVDDDDGGQQPQHQRPKIL